jgi:hypothetical protein
MPDHSVDHDPVRLFVQRLAEAGCDPRQSGGTWQSRCPAHDDREPSLSVSAGKKGVLFKCHADCTQDEIRHALGLTWQDLFYAEHRKGGRDDTGSRSPAPARIRPPTSTSANTKPIDWDARQARYRRNIERAKGKIDLLAITRGVSPVALDLLEIGWGYSNAGPFNDGEKWRSSWTFPLRTPSRQVVGINWRTEDDVKRNMAGSIKALFIPLRLDEMNDPVLVPEGVSDTAAILSDGYAAVGRPDAQSDVSDWIAELLRGREVIVIGDNDTERWRNGKWRAAGRDGARKLATALGKLRGSKVEVRFPPEGFKDWQAWRVHRTGEYQHRRLFRTPDERTTT